MPRCDEVKFCPLLQGTIDRLTCFEMNEIVDDECDMEFAPLKFDLEMAKKVCPECGWRDTPIE